MVEDKFKLFFGNQTFIEVGLSIGEDFGLVLAHAGFSQALDEGVGVEGEGLSLHGAQNSAWGGGGCKRVWRFPCESASVCHRQGGLSRPFPPGGNDIFIPGAGAA